MNIGKKITDARKAKNYTQEQLAELMSVTRQSISRWESDQSYPEMEKIVLLSEVLGVSCDYLLIERSETPSPAEAKSAITRLLYSAKGKRVKLTLYEDFTDLGTSNTECIITDFDGQWMNVEYIKGKKT